METLPPPGNQPDEVMRMCASCLVRERGPPTLHALAPLFQLDCCSECICGDCIAPAITSFIENNFLAAIDSDSFIYCPVAPCNGKLRIKTLADLTVVYLTAGVRHNLDAHLAVFTRALALRAAVRAAAPNLTPEAANTSIYVHMALHRSGVSRHIFTGTGGKREREAVEFASVFDGSCDEPVTIPVFTSLFYQKRETRTCDVCAEDKCDALVRFEGAFQRVNERDFKGDLHFLTERFPSAETLPTCAAAHMLDVCKACIGRHIHAHLEERGVSAVGAIACPSAACAHVYSPGEIRALTGAATMALYDRLSLLRALADESSFRWCVKPSCTSGAIYDTSPGSCHPSLHPAMSADMERALGPDARRENRIVCADCSTAMCFDCQVAWHKGLTCAEYTTLRARDDRSAETEAWLRAHTKRCPGPDCGVLVEKGGACFHMTCSTCKAEFCWECLADWRKIFPREGYNVEAHNEGCFFRSSDVPRPSFLRGNTIEAAVARNVRDRNGPAGLDGPQFIGDFQVGE